MAMIQVLKNGAKLVIEKNIVEEPEINLDKTVNTPVKGYHSNPN